MLTHLFNPLKGVVYAIFIPILLKKTLSTESNLTCQDTTAARASESGFKLAGLAWVYYYLLTTTYITSSPFPSHLISFLFPIHFLY